MREHRFDENTDSRDLLKSKPKKKVLWKTDFGKLGKDQKGSAGFSLIELMVAVGIGSIVALGVSTLFIFAVEQFTILVEQNNTEEEMLWASYHTRSFLSQAIELDVAEAGNPRITATDSLDWENGTNMNFENEGLIVKLYDSVDHFGATGSNPGLDLIAAFPRENGYATATGFPGSQLYSTAIFFQRPVVGLAGKLFFVVGSQTTGLNVMIDPGDDEIVYDRLTQFSIQTEIVENPNSTAVKAKSAEVTITGRYFRTSDRNRYVWCPLSLISTNASCIGSSFKDITMTINVGFRNNGLLDCADVQTGCSAGSTYRERLHGGLYFFKMAVPPIVY